MSKESIKDGESVPKEKKSKKEKKEKKGTYLDKTRPKSKSLGKYKGVNALAVILNKSK